MFSTTEELQGKSSWCIHLSCSIKCVYLSFSVLFVAFFIGSSLFLFLSLRHKDDDKLVVATIPDSFDPTNYWLELSKVVLPLGTILIPGQPAYKALQWMVLKDPARPLTNATRMRQRYALAAMYFQWSGPSWSLPTGLGWLKEASINVALADECTWEGIACNSLGQVTGLAMDSELFGVMSGKLASEIGTLTALQYLVLPGHDFYGGTEALNPLSDLRRLDLSGNRFTGFELASKPLRNLQELMLTDNKIKSVWDVALLQKASELRVLEVNNNDNLSGDILSGLDSLSNLERLNLAQTSLGGTLPEDIGRLTTLKTLVLGAGSLSKLPTSIGECVQLERFQVVSPPYTSNGLEGELVTEIGRLTKLRVLDLQGNTNIVSTIPTELGLLTNLEELSLARCSFEGTIPSHLGNIGGSLRDLFIFGNPNITGTIPTALAKLTGLSNFDLIETQLSGTMPDGVCAIGASILARCNKVGREGGFIAEVVANQGDRLECECCDCEF